MPELGNIVLAVTERDGIQRSFRRFATRQVFETILGQHLFNDANPIRPFRMAGRRQMIEAGGMGENERCHAIS